MKRRIGIDIVKKKKWESDKTIKIQFKTKEFKIDSLLNEILVDILDYEGLYQVSNLGRIKSICRFITKKNRWGKAVNLLSKEKLMAITKGNAKNKYPKLCLCKNNIKKTFLLHRIIALAFIPNIENKPFVNHIDGDKHNYSISNLEWVTSSENCIHALKTGLILRGKGENCKISKLKDIDILKIRENYNINNYTQLQVSKMFNISASYVSTLINYKNRII